MVMDLGANFLHMYYIVILKVKTDIFTHARFHSTTLGQQAYCNLKLDYESFVLKK